MADKIYPEGLRAFAPHSKAPDWVRGTIVITPNDFFSWLKKNENLLTEYKGQKQIRLQLCDGNKGLYLVVDEYKGKEKVEDSESSLPF